MVQGKPRDFHLMIQGRRVPPFLYGTAWKEEATATCVEEALAAGFRGIDTANQRKHYFEAGVGAAIEKSRIPRAELFLQTKFTLLRGQDDRLPYDPEASLGQQVKQSFASSLEHLQTDYIDSYVLHGPATSFGLTADDWEVWRAMEELQAAGKTKFLGVSNVSAEQLRALFEGAKIKPAFAQIRTYAARGWEREIRAFCDEKNIVFQGFSLLTANREIFEMPEFLRIVEQHKCTGAQLIFRFALALGVLPITGTRNPAHMKQDLASVKLSLNANEVSVLESILG